jgi:hypothetical protein
MIEIAREGQQGNRQDAFCLPAIHRGASGGTSCVSAAHAAARGGLAPPFARDGRRPAKNGHPRLHRTCGNAQSASCPSSCVKMTVQRGAPRLLHVHAGRRSATISHRDSRNGNRRAVSANRERESRGRIVAPFRRDRARFDYGTPCTTQSGGHGQ